MTDCTAYMIILSVLVGSMTFAAGWCGGFTHAVIRYVPKFPIGHEEGESHD